MKVVAWLAFAGVALLIPAGDASAARCAGARACVQPSAEVALSARKRSARRTARKKVRHSRAPAYAPAPVQVYPNRPAWASPFECYTDDGYGRFRPCSAGGAPP